MVGFIVDETIVRPATVADADSIGILWRKLVEYHRTLDADLPVAAPDGAHRYARLLAQRIDDPYTRAFVAEDRERIVGFVLGMIVDLTPDIFAQEPCGFLADIYVDVAYRRRGIGRQLVRALVEWFKGRGVPYFDWQVASQNAEGLAFWRALGGRDLMVRMRADVEEVYDRIALPDR
ncbi:MAG: GNAT family N-acetyltransferase [candidate division KSB1 bacterium]|nr:GNAT family N-acetyltransferase [candidate division KSB1 bacterium]